MTPTACLNREELIGIALGALSSEVSTRLRQHLACCPYCEANLQEFERIANGLIDDVRSMPDEEDSDPGKIRLRR